jgi:hypothetical protein
MIQDHCAIATTNKDILLSQWISLGGKCCRFQDRCNVVVPMNSLGLSSRQMAINEAE